MVIDTLALSTTDLTEVANVHAWMGLPGTQLTFS